MIPPSESLPASDPPPARWSSLREKLPAVRAIAITFVLAVWILSALPNHPYDAEKLAKPTHARTAREIREALRFVGIDASRKEVDRGLIKLSRRVVGTRNRLVSPLRPLFEFAGMGQRWGLFLQTGRTAYRIRVEGRSDEGNFRVLYRPHADDPLGIGSTLAFRRLRGIYNPGSGGAPRAQFEGFVSWLARDLFTEHPDLDVIRVRMQRLRLGTRHEPNVILDVAHESERRREEPAS